MIILKNEYRYIFPAIVKTVANINHGYKIKRVIKADKKNDRSSSISHNIRLIYVSANDKSVENLLRILPDGLVSKYSTGLKQIDSNISSCKHLLVPKTPFKFKAYLIILLK